LTIKEAAREESGSKSVFKQIRGYVPLTTLSVIWGLAFVAIRQADFELSPINLTLLRWLVASAGFLIIVPLLGKPKTKFQKKDLPRLLVVSLNNVVIYHLALNFAEKTVSAGLAGLLVSLGPVFVTVLSLILLKEKIGNRMIVALLLAMIGALILAGSDLGSTSFFGPLFVVIAALAYAVFAVTSKPLVQKYGPAPVTIWAGLVGTLMLLPSLSPSFVTQVASLSAKGWSSVLYLSLLSTVAGYILFYTLVSRGAVSRLSIQLYAVPIVSVLGGVILLGETVTIFTVIGGALLLGSIALATGVRK
jgi:drug/metabolite transporter (DMT)-like permease